MVPRPHFGRPRAVPTAAYDGLTGTAQLMASGAVQPLSLATEDFNEDGWPDLVAGYATGSGDGVAVLYFGDRDAYAPEKPETLAGIRQNRFPIPFLPQARAFALPEAPDFLAAGDFSRSGNPGILVGARESEQLYIVPGDGHGKLGAPQSVSLPGKLTAMAAGQIGRGDTSPDVAVGVVGINGPELLIYKAGLGGLLAAPVVYSLADEVTSLRIGGLDDDPYGDVAILAGGSLFILHGQLWGPGAASGVPLSPALELESVPLSSSARAIAVGDFIWERNNRMELAVLTGSGVQILSRGTPDKRPVSVTQIRAARQAMGQLRLARLKAGTPAPVQPAWQPGRTQPWQVVKTINVPAAGSASDLEAVTTALPNRTPQSVLLVGASSQLSVLTEPPGATNANPNFGSTNSDSSTGSTGSTGGSASQSAASWSDDALATGGAPVAVLPMRVDVSAQPGIVTLNQGEVAPMVTIGPKGPSITVTRTDDTASATNCQSSGGNCSLRGAIILANANPGTTISVPAGTYTLTIGENDDPNADPTAGDLDINANMTIVGAGASSTIIQANFPAADGQDGKIFGVNQDGSHDGLQVSISGVTLESARNSVGQNDLYFTDTGGAVDFFLTGTSVSYSLSSCSIQNNTNVHSYGGGINVDSGADSSNNFGGQNHGTVTISNCTIIGNTTQGVEGSSSSGSGCPGSTCNSADATGGGVNLLADIHNVVITNSTISNNKTGTGQSGSYPNEGGAVYIEHTNGGSVSIHATAIGDSVNGGNQSASRGGGIDSVIGKQALTINQGSSLVNNVSGVRNAGSDVAQGGGIYVSNSGSTSLTQVTIAGNSLSSNSPQQGGGGIAVGEVTTPVTVSFCRIAGNSASGSTGTGLYKDSDSGTVTATDNWWGCNAGPSASPCDTAVTAAANGSLSIDPWMELVLSPSAAQNVENGGTIGLTALLDHDSGGNVHTTNWVPDGTPVGFGTTGGIGSDNPSSTTTSSGMASSTFTASTVGNGTVTTTVDSQTVSTTTTVYVPVTIASSPSGESFTVTGGAACAAGNNYNTPQTLNWSAATCTVQFTSPVPNGTGAQLAFTNWSDDRDTNNPRTITTPESPATFTANFVQQYQLTTAISPAGGGTVTAPASGTFLTTGVPATLTAAPNSGYTFNSWSVTSGSATIGNTSSASTTVTLSSGPATVQANFDVQVTIASKLDGSTSTGLSFSVSGTGCQPGSYNTQQVLVWVPGSSCTVTFSTPQGPGGGTQYAFTQWDDSASPLNSRVFSVPSAPTTYTGDFTTQYLLTTSVSPAGAGSATPSTPTYYNINSTPAIQAATNAGYAFANWSSTAGVVTSPTSASTTVTMSAPTTVTANFNVGITVTTSPGGLSFTVDSTPYTSGTPVFVTPGVTHQLGLPTPQSGGVGTQYVFIAWSDSVTDNPRLVTLNAPASFTANFTTQYLLTTAANPLAGGSATPSSPTFHDAGSTPSIQATANLGYSFSDWSSTAGAVTAPNSASTTVTMSAPTTVTANFLQGYPTPFVARISPASVPPGGTNFTLTVEGVGFINGTSSIYWNGAAVPNPTSCTAAVPPTLESCSVTVPAANISVAGTASVTVVNPNVSPATAASNVVLLPITKATSTVTDGSTPFSAGTNPQSLAVGDFKGNGELDIAVANNGSNTVTILLGDGTGNFTAVPSSPPTGNGPTAIAVGDLNGDGIPDLAVTNGLDGTVTILLGNGDGTFTPAGTTPATGSNPVAVAVGDLNGDGRPDLAIVNKGSNTVTILLGNGDGTFKTAVSPPTGSQPSSVAVGDFNGDGNLDLAVTNSGDGTVTILLGDGTGNLAPVGTTPATGTNPVAVAAGDVNNDGILDLAVANEGGNTVTILLGNGNGTFTPAGTSPGTGNAPSSVAIGDFNGDGNPDLAVTNGTDGTVSILLGNGAGVFAAVPSPPSTSGYPQSVALGDFNADGRLDLVAANFGTSGAPGSTVSVLLQEALLTIAKTHTGNFTQGQIGATYNIVVANNGAPTMGTVSMIDTLPARGLTATALSGSGWTCTLAMVRCTRSDSLESGSPYPAITLMVSVDPNAPANVTNSAEVDWNTGSNTASDPTTILQPPTADSVSPNPASGPDQTFTLTYSTHNGKPYTDLTHVDVRFTDSNTQVNACEVAFFPASKAMYLLNDAGTAWSERIAGSGTLSNTQCTVNGASASGSNQTVTWTLSVSAKLLFSTQVIYMAAYDAEGLTSGWQNRGTWTPGPDTPPTADSASPNPASGLNQAFTLNYSAHNGRGYTDLDHVDVWFSGSSSNVNTCEVVYFPARNTLLLANDAGTVWQGPLAAGTMGTLSNSQCTVNGTGTSASGLNQTLTLTLSVSAAATFVGSKIIYMQAFDWERSTSGWQNRGTWTPAADTPPTADSVSPTPASGLNQTFTLSYSAHNGRGYADLDHVDVWFSGSSSNVNTCEVVYFPARNTLLLLNDAGTVWQGPLATGTMGTLSNSQCTVNGTGTSASGLNQTLTLTLSVKGTAAFIGTKNIYMKAFDSEGSNSGWQNRGTWTPGP